VDELVLEEAVGGMGGLSCGATPPTPSTPLTPPPHADINSDSSVFTSVMLGDTGEGKLFQTH
jgi:hypothetical protein